jgi:ribonuclease HII
MLLCGIDEAGYGPVLGPLCVGAVTLEVENAEHAADLWSAIGPVVCRDLAAWRASRKRSLLVCDSKHAKLANSVKTAHPLMHLERAVLAAAGAGGNECDSVAGLLEGLGVPSFDEPWYAERRGSEALPLSTTADHLRVLTARFSAALQAAGVRVVDVRVTALTESRFNRGIERLGNKAAVSFTCVGSLLRRFAELGGEADSSGQRVAVIDRQGGRMRYQGSLQTALRVDGVRVVSETPVRSAYRVEGAGPSPLAVVLRTEAERESFPVALASMAAKLVRELLMARFNGYWGDRLAQVKPTAGYATDGRRWLAEAESAGIPEVRTLARLA